MERHVHDIRLTVKQSLKKENGAIKYRYIEEEQTIHWHKEKIQKDKQRSTKHTHKTKDRVTRNSLKTGGEIGCSGRVISSWSTSGSRLATNQLMLWMWKRPESVYGKWNIYMVIFDKDIPSGSTKSLWQIDGSISVESPWRFKYHKVLLINSWLKMEIVDRQTLTSFKSGEQWMTLIRFNTT
jgi:hypothetical protein